MKIPPHTALTLNAYCPIILMLAVQEQRRLVHCKWKIRLGLAELGLRGACGCEAHLEVAQHDDHTNVAAPLIRIILTRCYHIGKWQVESILIVANTLPWKMIHEAWRDGPLPGRFLLQKLTSTTLDTFSQPHNFLWRIHYVFPA